MKNIFFVAVAVLTLCGTSLQSRATMIDTTGSYMSLVNAFGTTDGTNPNTYGQTFSVPGSKTTLNDFSLYLGSRYSGTETLDLKGYIAEWDGLKATNILYESSTQTMNSAGTLQEFNFDTGGLDLDVNKEYIAFISTANVGVQNVNKFASIIAGDVMSGEFVSMITGTDMSILTTDNWNRWANGELYDLWFKADFRNGHPGPNPVPEPATMLLFGTGLIGLVGTRLRSKK